MYWLVLSTFFWAATFGDYHDKAECEAAKAEAVWYMKGVCVPAPNKAHEHE